ncbi:hypothetical protein Sinac_5452 [Singulisphaera acidiphila DSM 18658]|uniref:Uncharacterized protein n=1 Tax=Singulisphaera acidiphila (strain ATCC BAA-1392 / DSM 18658 / VKM B-2454 / MOB10) TaxID=886293 RepID=L0DJN4_SINAD|nr:hypothetical protein Sinac_5452 [Singulisphaera acidiphila DSM 18658]
MPTQPLIIKPLPRIKYDARPCTHHDKNSCGYEAEKSGVAKKQQAESLSLIQRARKHTVSYERSIDSVCSGVRQTISERGSGRLRLTGATALGYPGQSHNVLGLESRLGLSDSGAAHDELLRKRERQIATVWRVTTKDLRPTCAAAGDSSPGPASQRPRTQAPWTLARGPSKASRCKACSVGQPR